ncbi:MAG: hypothetical protein CMC04_09535 [Flavobacteriaceae bacterium]|nr:hypothetical protein [Flavobacteriaceae bacterium]MBQ22519.1 hypothetical protein [Flavobacteriales bacterium]|tara:strand:- start:1915 stop:2394 length:480 start_codon:yes stop_codon:yes gene_type:complete
MILRIRTILDVEEDVLRDIEIDEKFLLKDLHDLIIKSYGFEGKEMASFYKTNESWEQGDEMSLFDLGIGKDYSNDSLNTIFNSENNRLIYVYDFLELWTFFIEVMEISEINKNTTYPNLVFSKGKVPENSPSKIFQESNSKTDIEKNEDNPCLDYDDFY